MPGLPLDRKVNATLAKLTGGVSPAGLAVAWTDWATHVALSPERQQEMGLAAFGGAAAASLADGAADKRFAHPLWAFPPYAAFKTGFLAAQNWWETALAPMSGFDAKHQRALEFYARQMLDMWCPTNFSFTNPVVTAKAIETSGASLMQGWKNWQDDLASTLTGHPRAAPDYVVGETLAVTSGDVVYRNRLVEVIRYHPSQEKRQGPPIFIMPAWIMKYYVLDLSPHNSMVRYLVDQGFDVFMLSWKNPDKGDADLDLQDYLDLGIREVLGWLRKDMGITAVHGVGYCLGGTLLSIAAAAYARDDGPSPFATLTLLASQTDFTEPGELGTFMTEAQVGFLEDIMEEQGYLEAGQMAAAFQMLRPADLIWSRVIRHYLLGERTEPNDLMVWNADATRMPAKMHTTYLRKLFLENALARRSFKVDGRRISLTDIRAPIYCLATESDHVSPWRSVFKLLALTDTDVRFVLTNGGHNGGVLSEPGHKGRHFRAFDKVEGTRFVGPDAWLETADTEDGSWWIDWAGWLKDRSKQGVVEADWSALGPAPGTYVFD